MRSLQKCRNVIYSIRYFERPANYVITEKKTNYLPWLDKLLGVGYLLRNIKQKPRLYPVPSTSTQYPGLRARSGLPRGFSYNTIIENKVRNGLTDYTESTESKWCPYK